MNKPFKTTIIIKETSFSGWVSYLEDGGLQFVGSDPPYLSFEFFRTDPGPLYICISNHPGLDRKDVRQELMNDIYLKAATNKIQVNKEN